MNKIVESLNRYADKLRFKAIVVQFLLLAAGKYTAEHAMYLLTYMMHELFVISREMYRFSWHTEVAKGRIDAAFERRAAKAAASSGKCF